MGPLWALDDFSQCTESWLLGSECGSGVLVAAAVRLLSSALPLGAWRSRLILLQIQWAARGGEQLTCVSALATWLPGLEVRSQQGCHQSP